MNKRLDTRPLQHRIGRQVVGCLAALALGGCAIVPAEPSDVASDGGAGAAKTPPPCYDLVAHWDTFTSQTVAVQASLFASIFVGTFRGRGTAFWNTPTGEPPGSAGAFANIYTPIIITPATMIRGRPTDASLATVEGGVVGCSKVARDPPLELNQDVAYLFFSTGRGQDSTGKPLDMVVVSLPWPISGGNVVETPEEGGVPLTDVIAEIEAHPLLAPGQSLPPPTQNPNVPPEVPPTDDSNP